MPQAYLTDKLIQGLDAERVKDGLDTETWWDEKEPGFGVRVSGRTGKRRFVVRYRARGKRRRVTLGEYPNMSLKDARAEAKALLGQAALGEDPMAPSREGLTFGELADRWMGNKAERELADSTLTSYRGILKRDVKPALGSMPAHEVERRDVADAVDAVTARGAPVQASRVLSVIRNVLEYGIGRQVLDENVAKLVSAPKRGRDRNRWLAMDEIRQVWSALEDESRVPAAVYRMRLLTGARGKEIKAMRHGDVNGDTWTIRPETHKTGKRLELPLSPQARTVLDALTPFNAGSEWIFPSDRTDGHLVQTKHLMNRVRDATGLQFQSRDLRRTFATQLAKLGVERIVISHLLGHSVREITDIYDRHRYDAEMRDAVDRWGVKLEAAVGEIVPAGTGGTG